MKIASSALPVTIISGYLGAGKTTLVNHLLRHADGRKLMVLVNDFGDLAIDADLIQSDDGDIVTLSNGCVCCSLGSDLFEAFLTVLDRTPKPDHLIIEASGIARPQNIANIARAEPDLHLDGIVTLVDAELIEANLANPQIASALMEQISSADMLLINKSDLVTEQRLQALRHILAEICPGTPALGCKHGAAALDAVLGAYSGAKYDIQATDSADHSEHYVRWSCEATGSFDLDKLKKGLAALPPGVLRFKGIIRPGDGGEPVAIHRVGHRVSLDRMYGPAPPVSHMVAIGLEGQMDPAIVEKTVLRAKQ
ncbi:GTP-binding protein [Hoeflea sp. TYP-13]|uniref:GTP-binding protein n=1 Tax=Hoeflea sp. TYP-13 TaxID=3230023 RepID=UPI0034C693FF